MEEISQQINMENAELEPNMIVKLSSEFIGTMALVLIGCGSVVIAGAQGKIDYLGISLAFGLTITCMAYTFGAISGGHFNPAVTVGLLINNKIKPLTGAMYIIAQVLGAIIGSGILYLVNTFNPNQFGQNVINPNYTMQAGIIGEFVFTALFIIVILGSTAKIANSKFAPLAIGFFLTLAHLVLIPVTGTSLNPARSVGPALFAQGLALEQIWIFILIPILGAIFGGLVWKYIFAPIVDRN
jgi:aquaporin Z